MNINEKDMLILREDYDDEYINRIDPQNALEIYKYLLDNGVYYAKDLFLSSLELFLLSKEEFIKKFEYLKQKLGGNYVDMLGEDTSLIKYMYE